MNNNLETKLDESFDGINSIEYSQELEEANAAIERGEFVSNEEVFRLSKALIAMHKETPSPVSLLALREGLAGIRALKLRFYQRLRSLEFDTFSEFNR